MYSVKFTIAHSRTAYIHLPTYRKKKIDFFLGTSSFFLCMTNLFCSIGGSNAFPGMKIKKSGLCIFNTVCTLSINFIQNVKRENP